MGAICSSEEKPHKVIKNAHGNFPHKKFDHSNKEFNDRLIRTYKVPKLAIDPNVSGKDVLAAVRFIYMHQGVKHNFHILVDILCSLAYNEMRNPKNLDKRIFNEFAHDPKYNKWRSYVVEGREKMFSLRSFGKLVVGSAKQPGNQREITSTSMVNEEFKLITGDEGSEEPEFWKGKIDLTIQERAYVGAWALSLIRCIGKPMKSLVIWNDHNMLEKIMKEMYFITVPEKLPPLEAKTYNKLCDQMFGGENRESLAVLIRTTAIYLAIADSKDPGDKCLLNTLKRVCLNTLFYVRMNTYEMIMRAALATNESPFTVLKRLRVTDLTDESVDQVSGFLRKYGPKKVPGDSPIPDNDMQKHHSKFLPIARLIDPNFVKAICGDENKILLAALCEIVKELEPCKQLGNYELGDGPKVEYGKHLGLAYVAAIREKSSDKTQYKIYKPDRFGRLVLTL